MRLWFINEVPLKLLYRKYNLLVQAYAKTICLLCTVAATHGDSLKYLFWQNKQSSVLVGIHTLKISLKSRTFKIERITIFIFSFCIRLVTQINDPALGVLKNHYITKRIRELLIANSRFLIYNLLNQLLYYTA